MPKQEQTSTMRSGRGSSTHRFQHTHRGPPSWCKQMLPQEAGHAGLQHNVYNGVFDESIAFGKNKPVGAPTCECASETSVVFKALPGNVNIHQCFGDGLAIVDHFQLCNLLPSFLFICFGIRQKCKSTTFL